MGAAATVAAILGPALALAYLAGLVSAGRFGSAGVRVHLRWIALAMLALPGAWDALPKAQASSGPAHLAAGRDAAFADDDANRGSALGPRRLAVGLKGVVVRSCPKETCLIVGRIDTGLRDVEGISSEGGWMEVRHLAQASELVGWIDAGKLSSRRGRGRS